MIEFTICLLKFAGLILFISLAVYGVVELKSFIKRRLKKRRSRKHWVDIKECDRVHARPGVNLYAEKKGEQNES